MTFADLLQGASVFLDSNTLILHFVADPALGPACSQLLRRTEIGEIQGVKSAHFLSEVAHRLMTIEASKMFGWPYAGIAPRLRHHPDEVTKLTLFKQAVSYVRRSQIQVLPVTLELIDAAATVSEQNGLLSNDALIVAIMQVNGLANLASNDADFDSVPGIHRFAPA